MTFGEEEMDVVEWLEDEMAKNLAKYVRHIVDEHNWDVDNCQHTNEEIHGEVKG